MVTLETQQENTMEDLYQNFEIALEQEDQYTAECLVRRMKTYSTKYGEEMKTELMEKSWYCGECGGTGEVEVGEYDNLEVKPCVCTLTN